MNTNTLPQVPQARLAVYEYYKLAFDSEGCPMKRMEDGCLVFHPLLAAYLVVDYMTSFKETKSPHYLACAIRIAQLALKKANTLQSALVFWYHPDSKLSYVPGTFYSALTQAWYIKALCTLRPYSSKRHNLSWNSELKALFNSLLISVENNGVLIKKSFGWTVEEYPHKIPFYTLNGWLTTLRILRYHRTQLLQAGIDIDHFLAENLKALQNLLPLYDASFCHNSRYQLAGFTRLKIVFDRVIKHDLKSFSVEVPGDGTFCGELSPGPTRWSNYLERREPRMLQFNVVRSLASAPQKNVFNFALSADRHCSAQLFGADGDYDPALTGMPTQRWKHIKALQILPQQAHIYTVDLPFDEKDCFAYPTNFKKLINGKYYNAYHFIHIIALADLYSTYKIPVFKEYVTRWLRYVDKWTSLPWLSDESYAHTSYSHGAELTAIVEKYLNANSTQPEAARDSGRKTN